MAGRSWAFLPLFLAFGSAYGQDIQQLADNHFLALGYPAPKVFVTKRGTVDPGTIKDALFLLAEHSATLDYDKRKQVLIPRFSRADPNYHAKLPTFLAKLAKSGMVAEGDTLIDVRWDIPGTVGFSTVGVLDPSGKPKFEPIMSFTLLKQPLVPITKQGSWITRYGRNWKNGWGLTVIEVEIEVAIDTQACSIEDPTPHVAIKKCLYQPLFEAKCTKGEHYWCRTRKGCQTPRCQEAQDCIKYATQVLVASGMDDVEIDATVAGNLGGVQLDATLKIRDATFGANDTWEHIGNLCALIGDPFSKQTVDGLFVGRDSDEAVTEFIPEPEEIVKELEVPMGVSGGGGNRVVTHPPEKEKPLGGVR